MRTVFAFIAIAFFLASAYAGENRYGERSGWICTDVAWVTREMSNDAKIVGFVKKRAAVSVWPAKDGWLQLVPPAPVRDAKMEWVDCRRTCYIRVEDFTETFPGK